MGERISNRHLRIILCKMCSMVGADPALIDFKQDNWYMQYSWTREQEDEFREWLRAYLRKDRLAFRLLTGITVRNKILIDRFIESFLLYCGWTTKE